MTRQKPTPVVVVRRKKTTIILDQTTAKHLRIHALKQDKTMSAITEDALHQYFAVACPDWKTEYIILSN
jgi:predicted transcriptional regulator